MEKKHYGDVTTSGKQLGYDCLSVLATTPAWQLAVPLFVFLFVNVRIQAV